MGLPPCSRSAAFPAPLAGPRAPGSAGHRSGLTLAGLAASELAGRPSDELFVAALTGTNGKSTVVHLLQQAWQVASVPAARVGTLGFAWAGKERAALNTTPAADELHAFLAETRDAGARAVAVEASSHGIAQHRLAGLAVDVLGWTNLSHDHLDYHGDLESYAAAKAQLVHDLPRGATAFLPPDPAGSIRLSRCALRASRVGIGRPESGAPWPS